MSEDKDIQFRKFCLFLDESDKFRRKQALEAINKVVSDNKNEEKELMQIWEIFHKPLVRTLNDSVEICRDLTLDILKFFILYLPVQEKNIAYIIPVLARRLSSQELLESSEEIRLKCISLIRIVIKKYNKYLNPYFDDLMGILIKTVTDNYPDVKRESCQAISELAITIPHGFYNHSEKFVKGILANFTHQHYRVRKASVYTIGDVLQYGKSIIMEEIATPMAQRLFDQSGVVRAAVIEVAGKWLINLKDKYSWWYKLIPLILTGLHDEIQEIRERSAYLWNEAGLKYLDENQEDQKIKDQMDFLTQEPSHYPPNIQRPNLGCRIIIQQNLSKLVNGIAAELDDWLVDIKIRSAQLLCVLVFNAEENVTINIEKLLPSMYRACNDEDLRVVENIELAAKYMGYFVSPSIYCPLVLLSLEDNITSGHLRVLASILKGSKKIELQPELKKIANFIQHNYNYSSNAKYQTQVLNCCKSLIFICKEECVEISFELFNSIFSIKATSATEVIRSQAKCLLDDLIVIEGVNNINELYLKYIQYILKDIEQSCEAWTIYSPNFKIFQSCILDAWCVVISNFKVVIPIFEKTISNNADAEVRLNQYICLSQYLSSKEEIFQSNTVVCVTEFINSILQKVISPGLIWSAGRTAEAIRTASVCCLCALLEKILLTSKVDQELQDLSMVINDFSNFFNNTIPVLVSLLDDNSIKTRFYSLKAICQIVIIGRKIKCINAEHIHTIYPILLKRLDDGSDEVRCGAIEALQEIWKELPENYDLEFYITHIDIIYTTTIIHLDDPETKFQDLMLSAMKNLGKIYPGLLIQKIEKCRYNFRNQQGLNCLLDYIQEYLKNK